MKIAILSGGLGSRLAEETEVKPKPMVEIGGQPILWHIMKHYAHFGSREFFVALGYRGEVIKRYFLDQQNLGGHLTINMATGQVDQEGSAHDDWVIHLVDTGKDVMTGGRLKRLQRWLRCGTF